MDLAAEFLSTIQEGLKSGTGIVPQGDDVEAALYDWDENRLEYQIPPHEDWTLWLFIAGRGTGKALALDTLIPTPSGWTTMGDIQVGDQVFDDRGNICTVTGTFDTFAQEPYRFTFSDGTTVDACEDHQWVTLTAQERKQALRKGGSLWGRGGIRTTKQIVETLTYGLRGDRNHCVMNAHSLDLPEVDLPIRPYTLGVWLGDGSSACAEVTLGDRDALEILEQIKKDGYGWSNSRPAGGASATYSIGTKPLERNSLGQMRANGSLHSDLKAAGLLHDKHIPPVYLRAHRRHRHQLLMGLMDSDGHQSAGGPVEFCSTKKCLAEGVFELAASLGQKPVLKRGDATLDGRIVGDKWRVTWTPTIRVFSISSKQADRPDSQQSRHMHRMIVSAERLSPQAMKCISVDSPSCMYLITKAMIPTHNTRTGAEVVRKAVESGEYRRIGIIGATAADTRDVIVEGESGILAISPPWFKPEYSVTKRQLTWPNGAIAKLYSADEPGRLNGPQHDFIWADELGIWRRPEAWDMAMLGLRLGNYPRALVTTTPKTSMKVRKLIDKAKLDAERGNPSHIYYTRASTYQNPFLPDIFFQQIKEEYEGTRLERSEIYGEILDDAPGAIFKQEWIDGARAYQVPPVLHKVVVAIDPSASAHEKSDLTGIIVAGRAPDKRIYIIEDCSGILKPDEWSDRAVTRYRQWEANAIIAERNNGGDMIEAVIRAQDPACYVETVWASRGKIIRAEPVAQLYTKGMVCHVGQLHKLEAEMTQWEPGNPSPGRMDALVWAVTALGVGARGDWRCAYSKVRPQLEIARQGFGY